MNDLNTLLSLASAGAISFCLAGSAATILAMLRDKTQLRQADFSKGIAAFSPPVRSVLSSQDGTTFISDDRVAANEAGHSATARAA